MHLVVADDAVEGGDTALLEREREEDEHVAMLVLETRHLRERVCERKKKRKRERV